MKVIYGELGGIGQQTGGDCPVGWVVMSELRPDFDHVAMADGTWSIPVPSREQVEADRLRAYADPLTGSDRFFSESMRESLLGNEGAAAEAKAKGLERYVEIQVSLPWPPTEPDPAPVPEPAPAQVEESTQ